MSFKAVEIINLKPLNYKANGLHIISYSCLSNDFQLTDNDKITQGNKVSKEDFKDYVLTEVNLN